ncbi:heparinase II/III domain-containing protein [Arthrobacter sp. TB 26]|uniref:heparinase II/III domain-containing protein n=1 Tax=Arthrobacter sp. TB 26 TaxID=494420 RepID=UPI000428A6EB|nr:heparinase II/III family protein [Arthrobacter sp. TB 26]
MTEQSINFQLMKDAVRRQLPISGNPAGRERAERFLNEDIIVSSAFGDLRYDKGEIWADETQRTRARFVHGLIFFGDWHSTVLTDPAVASTFADAAVRVVRQWASIYGDATLLPAVSHHDETTAQRLIQLTCLLTRLEGLVTQEDFEWLSAQALDTARLLASPDFHSGGNNHGMFQDLALLYYAVMCEVADDEERESFFSTATTRLYSYFSTAFTTDGVHVENTPTYHLMVSKQVHGVLEILSAVEHEHAEPYRRLLDRAADYATHAMMPNGMYPPISDTAQQSEAPAARQNIFGRQDFVFAASAGTSGTEPAQRTLVLPDSGYAIYRSSWTDPNATFAFFSAAYNANYHKHSDDLSFFLRSKGLDLLSEAGPYGYDYKDPLTKYAYSSFAHNCVIVDGRSLPRTDDFSHLTTLEQHETRADGFHVTGRTGRLKDTVHNREVEISEQAEVPRIDIVDTVESTGTHTYDMLWNLGPEVEPVIHGQGFELFHAGKKVMDLYFEADVATTVSLHRGETKPRYLGWRFPRFGQALAAPTVRIRFEGNSATIKTRIRLDDFTYQDRGLADQAAGWRRSQVGRNLNYLAVPATSGPGTKKLVVVFTAIHNPGDFTFNYKNSLDPTGVNALYILDDHGDQGAYYFADHGDRSIFDAVQALIKRELERLGLEARDLVTAGSSKGGTAAIIHGAAAEAGEILVGAPQVRVGSFLQGPHPNILQFMTGSTSSEAVQSLDQVVFRAVDRLSENTNLSIVVGEQDHHYRHHVLPLHEYAKSQNKTINLSVLPGLPHSEIGVVYRRFLSQGVEQIIAGQGQDHLAYDYADLNAGEGTLSVSVLARQGCEIAFRLYRDSEMIAKLPYSPRTSATWAGLAAGRYRVRAFYRVAEDGSVNAFTTKWALVS